MPLLLRGFALLLILCAGLSPAVQAQPSLPDEAAPQISLITFGPGPLSWERFGHNAILVDDGRSRRLYNYGMFDFAQENFFLNFARGRMLYRLDVQSFSAAVAHYAADRRWVVQQQLALDADARRGLAAFLAWNAQPTQAEYRYDYFTDNCSTRVRDALDVATGGALRRHAEAQHSALSYRFEATRLIAPEPLLALGMDLGLGPSADRALDGWQRAFVPMALMQLVRELQVRDADGGLRPLLASETVLVASEAWPEPAAPPRWWLPALLLGLASAALLRGFAQRREFRRAARPFAAAASLFVLFSGLAGTVLLLGWLATEHTAMHANRNLLLLNPLSLLLLPATLRAFAPTFVPSRRSVALAVLIAGGAALTPLLLLLPQAQQNLPWIALLLPVHLVFALSLMSARHAALRPIAR